MSAGIPLSFTVNGRLRTIDVEARTSLADALREECGLTGTHVGCEFGSCGTCTIVFDGVAVRACMLLAVQAEGAVIETVEGLAGDDGALHPLQQAFMDYQRTGFGGWPWQDDAPVHARPKGRFAVHADGRLDEPKVG